MFDIKEKEYQKASYQQHADQDKQYTVAETVCHGCLVRDDWVGLS